MFKLLLGLILLSFACPLQRDDDNRINELIKAFHLFSNDNTEYDLEYVKEKRTFYFKMSDNGVLVKAYKILERDIHPEGIFLIENDGEKSIRILSIHNGNVFISERFVNGIRRGKTTNYIDIEGISHVRKEDIDRFVELFKAFLKEDETKKEVIPDVVSPPRTKND